MVIKISFNGDIRAVGAREEGDRVFLDYLYEFHLFLSNIYDHILPPVHGTNVNLYVHLILIIQRR